MSRLDMRGRAVLVTGASAGIGRATALRFASMGCTVIATGRRKEALQDLEREAAALGEGTVQPQSGDLTDPDFVKALAASAGDVDILVNNAGVLTYAPLLDMEPEQCEAMFSTNVLAAFLLTQAIARRMVDRRAGHIIMVTSTAAREVYKLGGVYCASKHALSALARAFRIELQSAGIRVSEIAPGMVDTDIRSTSTHPAVTAALLARTIAPLTAGEVADAILYAASSPENCCTDLIELRPKGAA